VAQKIYEIFSGEDLEIAERIQKRRLQLLIHSCIRYELAKTLISDVEWNEWSDELIALQSKYPEIADKVVWSEAFKNWDASKGALLPFDDPGIVKKAKFLVNSPIGKAKIADFQAPKQPKVSTVTKPKKPKTASNRLF
jgi:hypothetical protein